jgi:hypothetical protein
VQTQSKAKQTMMFFRSLMALGMLACFHGKRDTSKPEMKTDAHAPPPEKDVMAGLKVAQEHATSIQDLAMEKQQEINAKMQEAVEKGEMVDMAVVMELNGAIQKSLEAKQLSDKVSQHVDESKEFFQLVDAFKANNAQMELVKDELKEAHEAKTAHSEAEMKAAKDAWTATITQLVGEQQAQEQAGLADLHNRWNGLHASLGEITAKSTGLGVTVHSDVEEGKSAAEAWANAEMAFVCDKKGAGDTTMFTVGSSCHSATGGASLMEVKDSGRFKFTASGTFFDAKIDCTGRCKPTMCCTRGGSDGYGCC